MPAEPTVIPVVAHLREPCSKAHIWHTPELELGRHHFVLALSVGEEMAMVEVLSTLGETELWIRVAHAPALERPG